MVRLTRIYTRTGDGGRTRLVGGQQVDKDDVRIEAYGTVDELNACLGLVRAEIGRCAGLDDDDRDALLAWLHGVQQKLFNLGAELATLPEDLREGGPRVDAADVAALEQTMDRWNGALEPLTSFVLPGGGPLTALLHQARTVCRRAERRAIALGHEAPIDPQAVVYLNRLSDALFVASRWVAARAGEAEVLWTW